METAMKEMRFAEVRALNNENNNEMIIEGYAAKFGEPATHFGYTEIIDKRAFDNCDMKDVSLKYNHNDDNLIMARTRSKRLELSVDDIGLKVRANLANTTQNRDIYTLIQSGDLDKMSFAFKVAPNGDDYDYATDTRTITNIDKLFDVSVVDVPFYDSTEVKARSKEDFLKEKVELEKEKLKLLLSL